MTCCTPWITSGRSGSSAIFTMPLRRKSFGPCSERTRSMNISNVAAGIGVSVGEREGADALVVPVRVVAVRMIVMLRSLRIGLLGEPAPDVGDFPLRIVEAAVEQSRSRRLARRGIEDRRGRIERVQAGHEQIRMALPAFRRIEQVGLGQHDAVGDRDLLHRFQVLVERRGAVDGVDHGDHAVEPVAHARDRDAPSRSAAPAPDRRGRSFPGSRGESSRGRCRDRAAVLRARVTRSPRSVQHRQPLCSSTMLSSIA